MDDSISRAMVMNLSIDRRSGTSLYRQIATQIRTLILDGRLPRGSRLPAERELALRLGVNRTTIVNAYRELSADGLVEGHVGRGTIVLGSAPQPESPASFAGVSPAWTALLRPRLRWPQGPLVCRVSGLASQAGIISLASGVPNLPPSPHVNLAQIVQQVAISKGPSILQDSPVAGLIPLRTELARRLTLRGCSRPSTNQVFILSGSQQGLYLVSQLLLEPGQAVLVESPTYLGALEVFRQLGARLIEIPMDEQGIRVEMAARVLAHVNIRLIYTIPNYQNPTGSTLSAERRAALLSLAQRYQVPILEDDPYGDLCYDGVAPPAPIRSLDEHGYVLYLGSLSSVLGPGLRLGWLVAPTPLVEPLTAMRQAMDLHPNNLVQGVVHQLLADGSFDAHLAWVRQVCARRRDTMLASLKRFMPRSVQWHPPGGGFYVWCSLPKGLDSGQLLDEAAAEGVVFVPGGAFFADGRGQRFMRLSFVHASAEEIAEGIRRLAKAVKKLERNTQRKDGVRGPDRPIV